MTPRSTAASGCDPCSPAASGCDPATPAGAFRLRRAVRVSLAALFLAALAGCTAPAGGDAMPWLRPPQAQSSRPRTIDPTTVKTYDDIIEINQFWQPEPWLYDADNRPVGFKATVYFVSGQTERGVFVPGRILVWLYDIDRPPRGRPDRRLVYGWQFGPAESMLYRVRKRGMLGYFYGFPLLWGSGIDLAGREIEVVFGYERQDGRVITAPARRFKVPVTGGSGVLSPRPPALPEPEASPPQQRETDEPPAPPALGRRNPTPLPPTTQPAEPEPGPALPGRRSPRDEERSPAPAAASGRRLPAGAGR